MAQCIHAKLVAKFMNQFLHVGMSEQLEVKCALKLYVTTLPQPPNKDDDRLTTLQVQIHQIIHCNNYPVRTVAAQ